jgi:glycosyltransferase involved in cell wall biosynthesis
MFSVIIPTFGRPKHLKRAVESVLNQSIEEFELLIVDDNGDTSNHQAETMNVALSFKTDKLRLICHKTNSNGSVARNTGLKEVRYSYVLFLDDDDEFRQHLLRDLKFFMSQYRHSIIYWMSDIFINAKPVKTSSYTTTGRIVKDVLTLKTDFNTSCFCFKVSALRSVNGFNESLVRHQDIDVIARINAKFPISHLNEVHTIRHVDSTQNQPQFEKFLANKSLFYQSVMDSESITSAEIEAMKRAHSAHLVIYALKKMKILYVICNLGSLIRSIDVLVSLVKRAVVFMKKKCWEIL